LVEVSFDNITFIEVSNIDRGLCNTIYVDSNNCYETFNTTDFIQTRFVRVVSLQGECGGRNGYFGITSIDFYAIPIKREYITCKIKSSLLYNFAFLSIVSIMYK
jgi:hypothetical protein